jgi:hypothetical protein
LHKSIIFQCVLHIPPIIFLDQITLIIFSEECKLWSYSQWNFMHPIFTFSWVWIFFPICCCQTPLRWETGFHTHTKQQQRL